MFRGRESEAGVGAVSAAAVAAAALVIGLGAADAVKPVIGERWVCVIRAVTPFEGGASCDGDADGPQLHQAQNREPRQGPPPDPSWAHREVLRDVYRDALNPNGPRTKAEWLLEDCYLGATFASDIWGSGIRPREEELVRTLAYLRRYGSRPDLGMTAGDRLLSLYDGYEGARRILEANPGANIEPGTICAGTS